MKRFLLLSLTAGLLSSCSTYTPKDPKLLCSNLAVEYEVEINNRNMMRYIAEKMQSYKKDSEEYNNMNKSYNNYYDKYKEADIKTHGIMQELAIVRGEPKRKVIRYRKYIEEFKYSITDKQREAQDSNLFSVLRGYGTFCKQYGIDLHQYRLDIY